MGCVLWRCDFIKCPNKGVCDDIVCIRFLKHNCDSCVNRYNCVAYQRLDSTLREKDNNEKETVI